MKVFIGVGHGGSDPGAVANNAKEKDLNLSIALACRDVLARHGIEVKMSRTKDENDPLSEEIKECTAFGPDLAVDIHNNAGGGDGAEAYYHHGGGKSKTLAENILVFCFCGVTLKPAFWPLPQVRRGRPTRFPCTLYSDRNQCRGWSFCPLQTEC